jgi:DNA primase
MESSTIQKPDILTVLGKEGIELQQRGRHFWACCPLHSERTASFCVNPEKQSFKCYGCGKYGDAIDFVQHYKSLSFKDTLVYLGISSNGQVKTNPQETKRRDVVNKFREWCSNYAKYSSEMLRLCNRIDAFVKTPGDLELKGLSEMYLLRDVCQYHLSILNNREDETKFKLYEEVCYGNRNRKN